MKQSYEMDYNKLNKNEIVLKELCKEYVDNKRTFGTIFAFLRQKRIIRLTKPNFKTKNQHNTDSNKSKKT